ncbi:MAG: DUF6273 domain-containing protein [Spirochaetaceae bacterium]|jgi:hypothetical protein|nr:DUF6273 domain-containing protein [Spirochaetaceae bacterium]
MVLKRLKFNLKTLTQKSGRRFKNAPLFLAFAALAFAAGCNAEFYAQFKFPEWPVAGQESNPDLMVKLGVKRPGYAIGSITAQDVTNTFNRISVYTKNQSASVVNPPGGLGVIKLGDYVNLKSLYVSEYNGNGGAVSVTNTNAGSGKLRVMVVAINPYFGKNGNGTKKTHLIFHFEVYPGNGRVNPNNTNAGGYAASEIRKYLIGNYWPALQNAGVPDSAVWAISRRVANGGSGATDVDTIQDKLWLPTELEMFENGNYSTSYESRGNQGYFAYYDSNGKRSKSSGGFYWLASPSKNGNSRFCLVGANGANYDNQNSNISNSGWMDGGCGVAPAFCVR